MLLLRKCLFTYVSNFQEYNVHLKIKCENCSIWMRLKLLWNCSLAAPGWLFTPDHRNRKSKGLLSPAVGGLALNPSIWEAFMALLFISEKGPDNSVIRSSLVSEDKCDQQQEPLRVQYNASYSDTVFSVFLFFMYARRKIFVKSHKIFKNLFTKITK